MKDLVKQFLDKGISRRQLMLGLSAIGLSTVAARTVAQSLVAGAPPASPGAPTVSGTGGALFVAQLKAAGVEHIFFNPSTGDSPIFDALVDEPDIHLIKGLQEGTCVSMADGYARATGKPAVVVIASIGLPNAMTQMVNTFKDQIPLLVAVASTSQDAMGRDGFQEYDHMEAMLQPITKYYWTAETAQRIPETVRRALKFAATPPCGPVFLSLPANILAATTQAAIIDQARFNVRMQIRADRSDIHAAAKMLLGSNNPLLSVGDEITWCGGEKAVLELAELLGLPVAGQEGPLGYWSKPFPSQHPLYLGPYLHEMRFPGKTDVVLNLGSRTGEFASPGAKLISIRLDPNSLARTTPVDLGMVADLRLAAEDLVEALRGMASQADLAAIAAERTARARAYTTEMRKVRDEIGAGLQNQAPVSLSRLAVALEKTLARDTIVVADVDSGKAMNALMSFGGDDKTYLATGPAVFGWGIGAAFGAKLAYPNRPVVSILGDGSFLFGGPQPLWSLARYQSPIIVIVLNNHSYNNERNRIWLSGGRQFQAGRDMTCYIGSPDIDYVKAAAAFGVEGETVTKPEHIEAAIERAKAATVAGRPYLLDVHVHRDGIGGESTWHPPYSVAALRTRKV
jgi:benzoylformate decarboxylase